MGKLYVSRPVEELYKDRIAFPGRRSMVKKSMAYLSSSSLDCSTWRWYSMLFGLLASVDFCGLGAEVLTSREESTVEDILRELRECGCQSICTLYFWLVLIGVVEVKVEVEVVIV